MKKKNNNNKEKRCDKRFCRDNFSFLEASFGIAFTLLIHDKNI